MSRRVGNIERRWGEDEMGRRRSGKKRKCGEEEVGRLGVCNFGGHFEKSVKFINSVGKL